MIATMDWVEIKDGDDRARGLYRRHYSSRHYKDGRNPRLFIGPGEKMVLLTQDSRALLAWRKFRSRAGQRGVNCAIFRNEGSIQSSILIRKACRLAWQRWPGQRLYTYVNPAKLAGRNPGYCFKMAGWRVCGRNANGRLIILEIYPDTHGRKPRRKVDE